jgi:hypothetical protein
MLRRDPRRGEYMAVRWRPNEKAIINRSHLFFQGGIEKRDRSLEMEERALKVSISNRTVSAID